MPRVECAVCGSKSQEGEDTKEFMRKHNASKPKHIEFKSVKEDES